MEIFTNYLIPVIVGLCLVVGFLFKHVTSADNRFIPIVVTVLGVALSICSSLPVFTPVVILSGAVSGLASTGMHQLFKQWTDNGGA